MTEMEEICKMLEGRSFEALSIPKYHIQVYRKGNLLVRIEDKEEKHE
jgi:hypothetical protein